MENKAVGRLEIKKYGARKEMAQERSKSERETRDRGLARDYKPFLPEAPITAISALFLLSFSVVTLRTLAATEYLCSPLPFTHGSINPPLRGPGPCAYRPGGDATLRRGGNFSHSSHCHGHLVYTHFSACTNSSLEVCT